MRQTLQHWGYRLTRAHFDAGTARVKAKGAAYVPRSQLAHVLDAPAPAPAAPPAPRPRAPPRRRRDDSDADAEDGSSDTDATPLAAARKPKSKQPKRSCRRD